jgi:hypothetical protein
VRRDDAQGKCATREKVEEDQEYKEIRERKEEKMGDKK